MMTDSQDPGTQLRGEGDKYGDALRRFSGDLRMSQQVFASMEQRGESVQAEHWRLLLDAHLAAKDLAGVHGVIARMCASLNERESDEPRCPLVPKLTRCCASPGSGRSV
jgi:hypothetical protein